MRFSEFFPCSSTPLCHGGVRREDCRTLDHTKWKRSLAQLTQPQEQPACCRVANPVSSTLSTSSLVQRAGSSPIRKPAQRIAASIRNERPGRQRDQSPVAPAMATEFQVIPRLVIPALRRNQCVPRWHCQDRRATDESRPGRRTCPCREMPDRILGDGAGNELE